MTEARENFVARGAMRELFFGCNDREVLVEGPSGPGKTYGICWLFKTLALSKPGLHALMVRKTQVSLTASALVTLQQKVLTPADRCQFFGGSEREPAAFRFANSSSIVVGGLDNPDKIMGREYDLIFLNEATEATEDDWEKLTTRLRPFVLTHPAIIGDCNPSHDGHWLIQRCHRGQIRRLQSRLEDNPLYYDDDGNVTEAGRAYIATLDALTGLRYERLRLGLWTGVENAIYPQFDRAIHVQALPADVVFRDGAFGVDYGRVHRSAVAAVSVDTWGRRWVREVWAEADAEHGSSTAKAVARLRIRYSLRRGRVDPNQDALIGLLGSTPVRLAEANRQARIDKVFRLLNVFAGGRVPSTAREMRDRVQAGPYAEPDSPGLLLVAGAPGIEELANEIAAYSYEHRQTATRDDMIVVRKNDDRIAAVEYAIEELELAPPPLPSQARMPPPPRTPVGAGGWRSA